MEIKDLRREIDEVDDELLMLLNRRAALALEIGKLKRVANLPLLDPSRERYVIERACRSNRGPFDTPAVTRLFRSIIDECCGAVAPIFGPNDSEMKSGASVKERARDAEAGL